MTVRADADQISYGPADRAKWDIDVPPGEVNDAIDQLASRQDQMLQFFNGACIESISITVTSDGSTITFSVEQSGGGDMTWIFNGERIVLDTTPAATVRLTAGSDAGPQINYVYVTESSRVLTLTSSTSAFPTSPHGPIATVLCQSASSLQTDGAYKVHAWTDHFASASENGHLDHINRKFRQLEATWVSGVAPSDISSDQITTAVGVVFQLHEHAMPARDMSAGDPVWVVNDSDAAYTRITDFGGGGIDKLSDSTAIGNNKYVNLVLWGVVSEAEADCKLMMNLPTGQYAVESEAQTDTNTTAVYAIPSDFTGTGFLIARYTLQYDTTGGGTWTQSQKVDLRGLSPSTAPGGGAIGNVVGPASSLDDGIARYDGATGKLLQDSLATIDDAGNLNTNGSVLSSGGGNLVLDSGSQVTLIAASAAQLDITVDGDAEADLSVKDDQIDFHGNRIVNAAGMRVALCFGWPLESTAVGRGLYTVGQALSGHTTLRGYLMPWAGSIIAVSMVVDVNAWTQGNIQLRSLIANVTALTATATVTGVAEGYVMRATAVQGTHTFAAGESINARRVLIDTPIDITTDDTSALIIVEFDA